MNKGVTRLLWGRGGVPDWAFVGKGLGQALLEMIAWALLELPSFL